MHRIRPNGAVEEIDADPTPEERRRREEAIEVARNRDLAALQARIAAARKTLEGVERDRKRLDQEAEFYAKRELPATLKNALETNETRRKSQQKVIDEARAAMDGINDRYDALVRRYRELTRPPPARPPGEGGRPPGRCG